MDDRAWVPFTQLQVARHLNWAAAGACVSASLAPSRAATLTPLSAAAFSCACIAVAPRSFGMCPVRAGRCADYGAATCEAALEAAWNLRPSVDAPARCYPPGLIAVN